MPARDYDRELTQLAQNIQQLDDSTTETMKLEEQLLTDRERLLAELGSPAVALDPKAFKKCNQAIEAANVNLATASRSMAAITKARMELAEQAKNAAQARCRAAAIEYGKSAIAMADAIDSDVLPELRRTLGELMTYIGATGARMGEAGHRRGASDPFNPTPEIAMTLAAMLRECGLDVVVHPHIANSRASSEGFASLTEAMAAFIAEVEMPAP